MLAWYPLDKLNAAGKVPDCSGNGHDADSTDVTFAPGVSGNAALFNGVSSKIRRSAFSEISISSAWTITAWMKKNAFVSAIQVVLGNTVGSYDRVGLAVYSNILTVGLYDGSSYTKKGGPITTGWHFIAARLYADGSLSLLIDMNEQTGFSSVATGHTAGFVLGATTRDAFFFDGLIDDVRLYDSALPDWELKAIYWDRRGRYAPWQPSIVRKIVRGAVQYDR